VDGRNGNGDGMSSTSASTVDAVVTPESVRWASTYDVGFYRSKPTHQLDDNTLQQLLENPWSPPHDYKFPFSTHQKQGKEERRFVGHQHLSKYFWVALSDMEKGLFCKYCVFFGHTEGGRSKVTLGNLVSRPLTRFSKLMGSSNDLSDHEKHRYHLEAVERGTSFLRSRRNPNSDIHSQLGSQHSKERAENRERLECALDNIIFLGRQGLALRGDNENDASGNRGNFLELMSFRQEMGDEKVTKHLSSGRKRDIYRSPLIQNDLIKSCGDVITETIVDRVKKNKFYSVLFDETTDLSHKSQLSLSVRYPYTDEDGKLTVREDFLRFVDPRDVLDELAAAAVPSPDETDDEEAADDPGDTDGAGIEDIDIEQAMTGEKLGKITVKLLIESGLDPNPCVGIGADGCSVNMSESVGAVQEIQKTAKNAVRCPCFNHALNLSISKSSGVPSVKKVVYTMKEVGAFLRASSKRHKRLLKVFHRTLPTLCETRWVQRHEAVHVFVAGLPEIMDVLKIISEWKDRETAGRAHDLLTSVRQPEFLLTLHALEDVLSSTVSLSRFLQKETIEMQQASDAVQDTLSVLEEKRRKSEEIFEVLFNTVSDTCSKFDIEISTPKAATRGRHPTQDAEGYYRQTIYNPILDNITQDLKQRLDAAVMQSFDLNKLLPSEVLNYDDKTANQLLCQFAARYASLLNTPEKDLLQNLKVIIRAETDS